MAKTSTSTVPKSRKSRSTTGTKAKTTPEAKTVPRADNTIYFKLSPRAIRFETPDGIVVMNRLEGITTGSISNVDPVAYKMVCRALDMGTLIMTKSKEEDEKPQTVDVTNFAEDKNKLRLDASRFLRKLNKEDLLERIETIGDPHLVAIMIEQESYGRNVSKRKREDVIIALKKRLDILKSNLEHTQASMLAYSELEEKNVKFTPQV